LIRAIVEALLHLWPLNRAIYWVWRYAPFPRGVRSRIIRTANDEFLVGVMAVILDDHGRVLLVRTTYDPRYEWSLPGGWMGRNEQPVDCVRRELLEETGFEIDVVGILDARSHAKVPALDLIYHGSIAGGSFRRSAEIVEAAFFSPDHLPRSLTPGHATIVRRYCQI
jgi:8-oxo-dGTP diphosphatase